MGRRYVAEFLGTFMLVFMGCLSRIMVGGDTHDFAAVLLVHLTFGFTIAVMVYVAGHISGAHFNPAITLGFAMSQRFPWKYVLPYWVAQFAGVIFASALHLLLVPTQASLTHFGATRPQIGAWQALVIEIVLTFLLMLISMATGTDRNVPRAANGLAVGMTIILCGLSANFLTGGSMNPARSFGPALFAGGEAFSSYWIYLIGPVLGALLAAFTFELMRKSELDAKCVPEDICVDGSHVVSNLPRTTRPLQDRPLEDWTRDKEKQS